jgi:hypothetical protein
VNQSQSLRRPFVALLALAVALALLAAPPLHAAEQPREEAPAGSPMPPGQATVFGAMDHLAAEGSNLIRLSVGAFDPLNADTAPTAPIARRMAADEVADGEHVYWVVQTTGDVGVTWAAIEAEVGEGNVVGFLPDSAYIVRATRAQARTLRDDAAVRWVGLVQPGWKMPAASSTLPALWELEGPQAYRVHAYRTEPDVAAVHAAVAAVSGVAVLAADGRTVDVRASAAALPGITAITGVEWVESQARTVPLNMEARWVNDTGVRDLPFTMTPGRLTGAGQAAAVADTGINYRIDSQGRANSYFSQCDDSGCREADWTQAEGGSSEAAVLNTVASGTTHRKMAAYFDIGNSGPEPSDVSAHGTHVAGSVAGDTGEWGVWDRADGMAPGARLVHQNIATPTGGLATPAGQLLWRQAYRPSDPESVSTSWDPDDYDNYDPTTDARTHNNSYGLIAPSVSLGSAEAADEFVWNHEDMVIVSSAGNSGPSMGTIGAPSIGFNVITSGASANGRQPMASIDSMAIFSSHGPTADGRFGVDLATPGQIVTSPKGGTEDNEHYLQGTSMSGPILAGFATLVREYFWDGFGPGPGADGASASGLAVGDRAAARQHNPSAALVRAALTNGADRMRGFYTGDEGELRAQDGQYPSAGQGFGLVNLNNSLFFDDAEGTSATNAWFHDVWRADDDAFAVGMGATREYTIHVAEGEPLNVTMAFTGAPSVLTAGAPIATNNLDLIVTSPSGATYVGNNFNTRENPGADDYFTPSGQALPDPRNPVEKIRVPEPEAGEWTITVRGTTVARGPQGFALAATGLLSEDGDLPFTPQPLQADVPGDPEIGDVEIEPVAADLAWVRFTTNEPTTATVTTIVDGEEVTYIDSYNVGHDGFPGLDEGTVETSDAYADRPVVTTDHEVRLTGLSAGEEYELTISVTDLAENETSTTIAYTSLDAVFQPDAPDIAQLYEEPADTVRDFLPIPGQAGWQTGTQIYAGQLSGDGALGAFMFRLPEDLDPDRILGATVELTSGHGLTNLYNDDVQYTLDLLDESVEPNWGSQSYSAIHNADHDARGIGETGLRLGGGKTYAFGFTCNDLEAVRENLSSGNAPFRIEGLNGADTSAFGFEFGFNRRSKGPDLRPRLILHLDDGEGAATYPLPTAADAPTPEILRVGVQEGLTEGSMVVTWETDVPADSTVLYREQGEEEFIQVGVPRWSTVHYVQLFGLDLDSQYEFAVRSTSARGQTTTADNGGAGWLLFRPDVEEDDQGPAETIAGPFGWEDDAEGWTVESEGGPPTNRWERGSPGHESDISFQVSPYFIDSNTDLISPELSTAGGQISVEFWNRRDLEPGFDFLEVGYSTDGSTWNMAEAFDGRNAAYPDFSREEVRFAAPAGPLHIRFRLSSDFLIASESGYEGVFVDDVLIGEIPADGEEPVEEEALPNVGPIPPASAESTDFGAQDVPVRNGDPTDEEIAAGTAFCGVDTAAVDPSDVDFARLGGAERIETAIRVSQEVFDSADTVVLARADLYPDALAGATLAHAEGGPILLTQPDRLVAMTADEIVRLGASRVVLLGGTAALSEQVEADLRERGLDVHRVGGANRFGTAALVAEELGDQAPSAIIAEGAHADPSRGWPDVLASAPFAAFTQRPILLVVTDRIPDETAAALSSQGVTESIVVGGTAAVSQSVFDELAAREHGPRRVSGTTRYETALAVYGEAVQAGMNPAVLWLATGQNWPDALVTGPAISQRGGTFLLVDGTNLDNSPPTRDRLAELAGELEQVVFIGGTAAISAEVEAQVRALLTTAPQ